MEKDASLTLDPASVMTPNSPPPPLSPQSDKHIDKHQEEFAANFASLYQSIFSPESQFPSSLSLSPSPSSSSSPSASTDITTEHRLRQARLILEYDELSDHYELCVARLQSLKAELESIRQENTALRLANAELLRLIHLCSSSSSVAVQSDVPNSPNCHHQISGFGSQAGVFDSSRTIRRSNGVRTSLPKSISVRSSGYLRMNHHRSQGYSGPSRQASHHGVTSQLGPGAVPQKVCVPKSGKGEKDAMELEVYRQGMLKTELCNKWQDTGACPYGDNCQFAHGIDELRPVIRHPKYKTEVCRMVVTGTACPYGHRCHFRHSLTEQERLLFSR